MMSRAYLSLGSNVGNREENLREAERRLGRVGRIVRISSIYETEPVEFTEQAWFLNCAVEFETEIGAAELLGEILKIEQEMGRRRTQPKGPRLIDIDIVLFGDEVIETEGLSVPHPAMQERRFVLEPLAELAAEVRHPVLKKTVGEMLRELPAGQVVRRT